MVFFSPSSGCGPDAVKGAKASPERGMLSGVPPIRRLPAVLTCCVAILVGTGREFVCGQTLCTLPCIFLILPMYTHTHRE